MLFFLYSMFIAYVMFDLLFSLPSRFLVMVCLRLVCFIFLRFGLFWFQSFLLFVFVFGWFSVFVGHVGGVVWSGSFWSPVVMVACASSYGTTCSLVSVLLLKVRSSWLDCIFSFVSLHPFVWVVLRLSTCLENYVLFWNFLMNKSSRLSFQNKVHCTHILVIRMFRQCISYDWGCE